MHMRETRIEKEVEICATNLANKIKCMNTNAKKWGENIYAAVTMDSASCSSPVFS
jgi:hypothetical protein